MLSFSSGRFPLCVGQSVSKWIEAWYPAMIESNVHWTSLCEQTQIFLFTNRLMSASGNVRSN